MTGRPKVQDDTEVLFLRQKHEKHLKQLRKAEKQKAREQRRKKNQKRKLAKNKRSSPTISFPQVTKWVQIKRWPSWDLWGVC